VIHAREKDFDDIMDIFKKYKEWLGHIRYDYIQRMIINNAKVFNFATTFTSKNKGRDLLIFEKDVVLSYIVYKVNRKLGTTSVKRGDCILHQICAKSKDGSASDVLQRFFKYINKKVYLTVRESNIKAIDFYEKNDMLEVGKISWKNNTIPGKIFLYNATT